MCFRNQNNSVSMRAENCVYTLKTHSWHTMVLGMGEGSLGSIWCPCVAWQKGGIHRAKCASSMFKPRLQGSCVINTGEQCLKYCGFIIHLVLNYFLLIVCSETFYCHIFHSPHTKLHHPIWGRNLQFRKLGFRFAHTI